MIPELSIIIPTLNERDNILPLVESIHAAMGPVSWEIIFVDDASTDGTLDVIHELSRGDGRIRYLRRVGRRGLSSACIEGMAASSAPFLAVMDADLQHDETLLPQMLNTMQTGKYDLVIGSRYQGKKITDDWSQNRKHLSNVGIWMAQKLLPDRVSDPLSGFFMLSRALFERALPKLSGKGFKILLDIFFSTSGDIRFTELPFVFRTRHAGESKLDTLVIWEYLLLLIEKLFGKTIPSRFLMFSCVGGVGMLLHLCLLWVFLEGLECSFPVSQCIAALTAIFANFMLNNLFTHRNNHLKGRKIIRGLVIFYITCALGAFSNILIATFFFNHAFPWWLAGLIGAIVGGVWNYAVSSVFVWPHS